MTKNMLKLGMAVLFVGSIPGFAQTNSGQPANATGQCKDGTYTTAANKGGACRGHQGVKDWFQTVGGQADPDIKGGGKGSRGSGNSSNPGGSGNGQATSGNAGGNSGAPASAGSAGAKGTAMSGARANAINKKSGDAVVATPDNNAQRTMPGPAANGGGNGNMGSAGSMSGQGAANGGKSSGSRSMANRTPAPGGSPGMVWMNTDSKVYHCYGTEFYGKTKQGQYMTEQQAQQTGGHADHGKSCTK